jgi:PAS domain S-box-containing protein
MERTIKKFNIFQDERQERWFELSTYPLREGASQEITGIVEFFRDITENKQKENRLRQYELTLESASDPIFLVDHQYRFVLVNEACVRFVGLTKDKILGRHITEILDKEVFAHHLRAPLEAALSGSKQTLETWLETPRLGRRYTSLSFTPFINEEKNNTGAVVNLRDLTQQQRMQQELIQAKDEANHANEAKSQFLAAMSHEIRTPMNAIVGMTDLALMTPDEADQHEYLTILKGSAQHLMGIINDILDIAKIESGKMELASEPFSLNKMLSSLYQVFRHEMAAKKLDFHLNISEKLPEYVLGDEIRLRQVLTNLLSNARKFTEHGYVSLKAELFRPAPEISVTFSSTPANSPLAWIRFEVQDSGIGIPPDRQEAIFDRFQQADTTTARRFGGTGLGLAISQQLLAQMGGELDLTSSPEQGSTFAATVPLPIVHSTMGHDLPSPKQPQELEKALPTDSPFPQSLHILLAEDNRINSKLAQKVLEKLGHGVQIVEDGRQALDELRRSSYDLVLMDVEMPRMDGLEACRRVRQGESGLEQRELPIIAMTAHALTDIQRKAEAAGMDGYITKPIDITTLDKTIREILNKQPLRPKDS